MEQHQYTQNRLYAPIWGNLFGYYDRPPSAAESAAVAQALARSSSRRLWREFVGSVFFAALSASAIVGIVAAAILK